MDGMVPARELKHLACVSPSHSTMNGSCCISIDNMDDEEIYNPSSSISQQIELELGLTEDYFSRPEGYFCFSTAEELEMTIDRCRAMIQEAGDDHDRKKFLVAKLVQLKLKVHEIKEAPEKSQDKKVVLGHNFELKGSNLHKYCEKCCGIIWRMVDCYLCTYCGFRCHRKCLNLITRRCASIKVAENGTFELSICPELGLSHQKFRCAECKKKFIFKNDACLPRLCDYSGLYYCSRCHWNSTSIIPARIIHEWDFTPRKICRASLQFVRLMMKKPILNIESLNPTLFALVADLDDVKKLREDILIMKKYFLSCHLALEQKLLLLLKDRQHFVEGPHFYSLQDLADVASGELFQYLSNIHNTFAVHITQHCLGCRGKGFICELCDSEDVIFPFDVRTDICTVCSSVFHQDCYIRWQGRCPKCARRQKSTNC